MSHYTTLGSYDGISVRSLTSSVSSHNENTHGSPCHLRMRRFLHWLKRICSCCFCRASRFGDTSHTGSCQKCQISFFAFCSQIPGIFVATGFAILDNVPYGLLIFPQGYEHLTSLGATMVILSTSVAQACLACFSAFPFGAGAFISENVPLLRTISTTVARRLEADGKSDMVLSTVLVCFVLSSFATSLAYWLMGKLKYGSIAGYIPKEVLLGYLMGMGTFIVTAGIGVATDIAWTWSLQDIAAQFRPTSIVKWSVPVAVELLLLFLSRKTDSSYMVPCVLASVPIIFYCCIFYLGISVETARASGWLFDTFKFYEKGQPLADETAQGALSNFNVYKRFNFALVNWEVVLSQFLTMLTIAFFSLLHAPINVPSLSLTAKVPSDLNQEMKVHGFANCLSAMAGGLQCYMTYSTSVLLRICGLAYRWASLSVAFITSLFVAFGPDMLMSYFPRPAAAVFLVHIGGVLLADSVVAPFAELDNMEYAAVWIIGLIMQSDFMLGTGVGLLLSFVLFVVRSTHANTIHASISGGGLRSKKIRRREEMEILKKTMESSVHVVKLQGSLFFGNAQNFRKWVEEIVENEAELKYLITDFSQVTDIDCTGVDKLAAVVRLAVENDIMLICSGMNKRVMQRASCWSDIKLLHEGVCYGKTAACVVRDSPRHCVDTLRHSDTAEEKIRFFVDLEDALMWCEERVLRDHRKPQDTFGSFVRLPRFPPTLETLNSFDDHYKRSLSATNAATDETTGADNEFVIAELATRTGTLDRKRLDETEEYQTNEQIDARDMKKTLQYQQRFVDLLASYIEEPASVLCKLVRYFVWKKYKAGDVLWRTGEPSKFAVIVESGLLAVPTLDNPLSKTEKREADERKNASKQKSSDGSMNDSLSEFPRRFSKGSDTSPTGGAILPGFEYVVVQHPVWNEKMLIHKNHFDEYFTTGEMAGELGLLAKDQRVNSLIALENSNVWCLSAAAVERLAEKEPRLLCIIQNLAIRVASHRLCYLMLHGNNFSV